MQSTAAGAWYPSTEPPLTAVRGWIAGLLVWLILLLPGLLWWRRLAGALSDPLGWWGLCGVGLLTAAVPATVRLAWPSRLAAGRMLGQRRTVSLVLSLAVICTGLALSLPRTAPSALAAFWAILLVEEAWGGWLCLRSPARLPGSPNTADEVDASPGAGTGWPDGGWSSVGLVPLSPDLGELLQHWTRRRTDEGTDEVHGWMRVEFGPGQRTANVHLAFCPPFARAPHVSVEQSDGPEVRIKTAQVLPFGVRFDLKLQRSADAPGRVILRFSAVSPTLSPGAEETEAPSA